MGRWHKVKWSPETLRRLRLGAVLALASSSLFACGGDNDPSGPEPPADEGVIPTEGCTDGVLAHGALYRICFPATWNGDLVLFAHGYVAPQRELSIPEEVVDGRPVSSLVTGLGYAYATTSYRANGLVAPDAVDDLTQLVDTVEQRYRPDPVRALVVGFSEGALVATLAVEHHPARFDGALAGCGPIGNFQAQLDYIDDFRVVFDYYFPGLLPGNAVEVPPSVQERWEEIYIPAIVLALAARPEAARELLQVTGAPVAGTDLRSIAETTVGVLWYNVFGTADAQARLGGNPFDNSSRVYAGSSDDVALNAGVDRFTADPAALAALARFGTSGGLRVPLVNLHTTGDPIVPFTQSSVYVGKVQQAGASSWFTQIDIERHGHCTFQAAELLSAFGTLEQKVADRPQAAVALTHNP
jgi:pimeloyl-ACP methyl ester carboxylesterase